MDPEPHRNHIYFRFVGGVTDLTRRSRRARLLANILSQYHFKVDIKGDLVVARVLHLPREDGTAAGSLAASSGSPASWICSCVTMKMSRNLWRPSLSKTLPQEG